MKKTIIFDFDGVIHKGYDGYRDGSIYGEIDYELLDFIKQLLPKYYICICSNRPKQQIIDFMNNLNYNELEFVDAENNLPFFNEEGKIGVSNYKIAGIVYIDDRGYKYSTFDKMVKDLDYIFSKGDR